MKNFNYVHDFLETLRNSKSTEVNEQSHVSIRVIELADQINAWHDTRPIPERWQPIKLGRLAAQLDASRELTAAALEQAGFYEKRIGTNSLWLPK
ncbi:MAG: hypothetical protein CTY33_05900 [Methylotenera sp.]|nr:MAG: hypothetical protein CTY33_05900 [Methylotenera sp.]